MKIPLRNRHKEIVAEVIVDDADGDWVNQWVWSLNANGYAWRNSAAEPAEAKHVYLHRALAGCIKGDGLYVDHINRDRLDNRRANLRVVTPAQAAQNKPALRGRYRGVSWSADRKKWVAHGQLDGKVYHLGRFDREEDAARVVAEWRRQHMPFSEEAAS